MFLKSVYTRGNRRSRQTLMLKHLRCLYTREADEVRAETEASTLAGRDSDGRRERVEESKRGERRRADR